jgi:xanthine dehydrogenase accessory factor
MAKICDYEVTVLDDRSQYAQRARFPTADRVIAGPFRRELQRLRGDRPTFDGRTCLVLVTRGHQYDMECLLEVINDPLAYVGMIGSQRRVRAVFELLEKEQSVPAEIFDRVYAPIGLDIGAVTPAEIAVCIMAEVINVLAGGPALSLSHHLRRELQARRKAKRPST